ncbi:permease prefix domain 1-containing protein [Asanoa sp. NPDC049573]|uniref:permease prefix domain 1-containing protein n=1 Tax=Asanoa sp. NPDC049573 TaxID=3155396 RepID=UPI003427CF43
MTSLTDRYVAATLRSVPAQRRDEIAAELRGSIEDMIEGRSAAGEDAGAAERSVLTELGNPAQLAARYSDRRLQLIGPTYYLVWERLMKVLLSSVPPIVGVVFGLVKAADGDPGGAVGAGIGVAIEVAVQVAFWVTLAFAVMERTNTALNLPEWTVDQLPRDHPNRQITLPDSAAAIGWLVLVIAYLPLQHFWSFIPARDGGNVPLLDPALWSFWLPFLLAVLVANLGIEIAKYRAGRWTWPLIAANAVVNIAFAVPVCWLLLTDRLLSPEFVARFEWLGQPDNLDTVANVSVVVTIVIVLWSITDSVLRCRRNPA